MFKNLVQKKLERLVKRYFKKHQPKLIVVVGSVGKTTTKTAIATVLATKYRVQMEDTNHNTWLSVPPAILGVLYPENVHKFGQWRKVFVAMRRRIHAPTGVDAIVQELGTDRPGEILHFGTYLRPDVAVITAVAPEHMENFHTIEAVAEEELSVAKFSNLTAVNRDDIDAKFAPLADTTNITDYGLNSGEYRFEVVDGAPLDGYRGNLISPEFGATPTEIHLVGDHSIKAAVAGALVGIKMGMNAAEIAAAVALVRPVAGRMNPLRGVRDTTIIDDTYNSSPCAVEEALRTLYQIETPQRVAILGSMNELGELSPQLHEEVGKMCDPALLDFVITIGEDAEKYLAPAAHVRGCQVRSFKTPYEAGAFANRIISPGAVVLVKGSQNGVFAEEATKILLAHAADEEKLVRQSPAWMKVKDDQFEIKYSDAIDKE